MTKKSKKLALYFSTSLMVITGGIKVKLCKDESKNFTDRVISYTNDFTDDDFQIAAHRGFSSLEVENTFDAVCLANSKDYIDYIEIDLRLTKDNKLVLSHNNNLLTLQNSSVKISNKKLKYLKKCEFRFANITSLNIPTDSMGSELIIERNNKLMNKKYQIATLQECMDELTTKKIILDLKFENNEEKFINELEKELCDIDISNIIFQSHDYETLLELKEKHPEYNVSAIIKSPSELKYADSFDNICVKKNLLNEHLIDTVISKNKCLFIWTLNNPSEVNEVANKLGNNYEDAIYITDYPDVIATCLHEKQLQKRKD